MNRPWTIVTITLVMLIGIISFACAPRRASIFLPTIAAGRGHTCRIAMAGIVECWGNNATGELGNGTAGSMMPIAGATRTLGAPATAISAGMNHTCVVLNGGAVRCWGGNGQGQLGNNSTTASPIPVNVLITNARDIAAGGMHTCAVQTSGTLQCWGSNQFGQLGNGTNTSSNVPVQVPGITNASQVTTSLGATCVLHTTGTVSCWGSGALGSVANSTSPLAVPGVAGAQVVVADISHTCALLSGGGVSCWGSNSVGELGDGSRTARAAPAAVTGISGATAIAVGGSHSCAVVANGEISCWGANGLGQLGVPPSSATSCPATAGMACSTAPIRIPGLSGAIDVTAGDSHTCALFPGAAVQCWGWNGIGQLGNGESGAVSGIAGLNPVAPFPVRVARKSLSVNGSGLGHSCALLPDGTARCWGTNLNGQLGNGVLGTGAAPGSATPVQVQGLTSIVQLAAGGGHTCALLSDATLRCWGTNPFGQLGVPRAGSVAAPAPAPGLQSIAVGAGRHLTCAVRSGIGTGGNSVLTCWGVNNNGQLGVPASQPLCSGPNIAIALACTHVPVTVPVSDVISVHGGTEHTCALKGSGEVWCWGQNTFGQLGARTTTTPGAVLGVTSAVALSVGSNHNCALINDGSVTCWGDNRSGTIGNGQANNNPVTVPFTVPGITATALAASGDHTCVLLRDGTVRCWGTNQLGQLGQPASVPTSSSPVAVPGLSGVTFIASAGGSTHTCAVVESGSVLCWGANGLTGQLGRGTTTSFEATPAAVTGLP